MADKLNDLAGRMGKGPKGLGTGAKLMGVAIAGAYGLAQSVFTVEGGHRAVMFNRIGGIQNYALTEGLHFRIPWFQVNTPNTFSAIYSKEGAGGGS